MSIHTKKYHECPEHKCDGILIVDVETEKVPRIDGRGNTSYYCPEGQHVFSVSKSGEVVKDTTRKTASMASRS